MNLLCHGLVVVLLVVCSSFLNCQASWCVQLDVEAAFNDVNDYKPITQKELNDVVTPIMVTIRSVLRFTCGQVDIDLGPVRHERDGSDVKITGSMFFTPRSPGEEDVDQHRECVKDSNVMMALNNDAKYFGKLRNKYSASEFLKSSFRDFCGPLIPIPPPDKFNTLERALVAIFVFCFLFVEMLVTGFLYLKYKKTSSSLIITSSSDTRNEPMYVNEPSTSSQQPEPSESTQASSSGRFPSVFSRKKPKRYEFGGEGYVIANPTVGEAKQSGNIPKTPKRAAPLKPPTSAPPKPPVKGQNRKTFDDPIGQGNENVYEEVKDSLNVKL